MQQTKITHEDYQRIAQAITYLEKNYLDQPTLENIAEVLHLSPFYTQRLFKRWAGITPKRFIQFLTLQHAQKLLEKSSSILDAALDSGLSGTSRLHDLFVNIEAVTPAEYKRMGSGLTIEYGFHPSPFGECLLAATERGICGLWFTDALGQEKTVQELQKKWPRATLTHSQTTTQPIAIRVFKSQSGENVPNQPLNLLIKGTNFQLQVWQALLKIPAGDVWTYADVAAQINHPTAARAVGSAIGQNAIGWLIPCHRVIRKTGETNNYRWGSIRKKAILTREWGLCEIPAVAHDLNVA